MEKEPQIIKKLIREVHTFVYELNDCHGRKVIEETQEINHEDDNTNKFGFDYEDTSIQKTRKRISATKQTHKTKKN